MKPCVPGSKKRSPRSANRPNLRANPFNVMCVHCINQSYQLEAAEWPVRLTQFRDEITLYQTWLSVTPTHLSDAVRQARSRLLTSFNTLEDQLADLRQRLHQQTTNPALAGQALPGASVEPCRQPFEDFRLRFVELKEHVNAYFAEYTF